jgi:hypothetical protein
VGTTNSRASTTTQPNFKPDAASDAETLIELDRQIEGDQLGDN